MDVDQGPSVEGRKSQETDRKTDRRAVAPGQEYVARRVRAQARHHFAPGLLRQRLAALHRIAHETVEHRDERVLMLRAREVRIGDRHICRPLRRHEIFLSSLYISSQFLKPWGSHRFHTPSRLPSLYIPVADILPLVYQPTCSPSCTPSL